MASTLIHRLAPASASTSVPATCVPSLTTAPSTTTSVRLRPSGSADTSFAAASTALVPTAVATAAVATDDVATTAVATVTDASSAAAAGFGHGTSFGHAASTAVTAAYAAGAHVSMSWLGGEGRELGSDIDTIKRNTTGRLGGMT